jgi:choline dehydrogenase-like flavoprotein
MSGQDCDAIVIGSGAGGAAAAHRLVAGGWRVLMLEKGAPLPSDGSTLDARRVVTNGEFMSREMWRDGRGNRLVPEEHFNLGGKTKWYGAALLRFAPHEFDADPDHQCRAWPVGYDDLAPYYEQAERLLRVREFPREPDLARIGARVCAPGSGWYMRSLPLALSPEILNDRLEATHFDGFATVAGLKADADNALIRPLCGNPAFKLVTGAEVEALLPAAGDSLRIAGVRLADGREFTARHILLAAGALHSPRLLEKHLRGQPRTPPSAASVGRFLKLHLLTAMVAISLRRKTDLIRKTTLFMNDAYPHSSVQALGFDGELMGNLIPRIVPRPLARQIGARAYGFFLQTEDGSSADNRVRGAAEGADSPVLDFDERRIEAARREHRRLVFSLQRALLRAGLVGMTRRIGLAGTAHACGTLAAGHDPHTSVVDARGRVHGLQGLYVVDGSVLSRSSRVNPSLTIMAWALRTADLMLAAGAPRSEASAARRGVAIGEPA